MCLYVCVEGDGAGREQQREAWREVARGALEHRIVTLVSVIKNLTCATPPCLVDQVLRPSRMRVILYTGRTNPLGMVSVLASPLFAARGTRVPSTAVTMQYVNR